MAECNELKIRIIQNIYPTNRNQNKKITINNNNNLTTIVIKLKIPIRTAVKSKSIINSNNEILIRR